MPRTADPMAYAFAHDAGLGQESATVPSRQAAALNHAITNVYLMSRESPEPAVLAFASKYS
jgi:hypothetical protein